MLINTVVPRRVVRRSLPHSRNVPSLFGEFCRGAAVGPTTGSAAFVPRVDVSETDETLLFVADLPGVGEGNFEVSVDGDVVTIKGEKKVERPAEAKGVARMERAGGEFSRSFRIPFDVDAESVSGVYRDGVLTITVPKPAAKQVRSIPISTD